MIFVTGLVGMEKSVGFLIFALAFWCWWVYGAGVFGIIRARF